MQYRFQQETIMARPPVTNVFKRTDDILKQLVTARCKEVVRLQKAQADQLKDLETRGRARMASLKETLPDSLVSVLDSQDKQHEEASATTAAHVERIKAKFADSAISPENETAAHPGLAAGHLHSG
jgi:hypothetical protein